MKRKMNEISGLANSFAESIKENIFIYILLAYFVVVLFSAIDWSM